MLKGLLAAGWLIAWLAPETAIGGRLHHWLVAAPATYLNRLTRGQVLLTLAIALLLLAAAWLGHDALNIVAMGSPDLMGMLSSVEASVWLDAAAGAVIAWANARRLRPGRAPRRLARPAPRARRVRAPVRRLPANDDATGDGAAWVDAA